MNSLSVAVDATEYSKFVQGMSIVTSTLTMAGANAGDTIGVNLVREDGYGTVETQTITATAGQTAAAVTFDLNTINGPEGFNLCRQGYYHVEAVSGSLNAVSQTFWVAVVPVSELKNRWCYGIPFSASEILAPKLQPRVITGVKIKEVPNTHTTGVFLLAFSSGGLTWNNGTAVTITPGIVQDYILVDAIGNYIVVTVNPAQLPANVATEAIVIDRSGIADEILQQDIQQAYDAIFNACYFYPEPTYVATDPNTTAQGPQTNVSTGWADVIGLPITYYREPDFMRWMTVKFVYNRILKINNLTGWFNDTLTLYVPLNWIVWNGMNGEMEMVPSNGAVISWQFYESAMLQFLYIYNSIPSFWHYWIITGLPSLDGEYQIVREAIAKIAAINAMTRVGTAYAGGLDSVSESKDGVTETRTFSKDFPGAGLIKQYESWLYGDKQSKQWGNMKRIRDRICGPQFIVV